MEEYKPDLGQGDYFEYRQSELQCLDEIIDFIIPGRFEPIGNWKISSFNLKYQLGIKGDIVYTMVQNLY